MRDLAGKLDLLLEAGDHARVGRDRREQCLHRNPLLQLQVFGFIHLAHAATIEEADDPVTAGDRLAGGEDRWCGGQGWQRWAIQEAAADMLLEHFPDLREQLRVVPARHVQELVRLGRGLFENGVEDLGDSVPSLRGHEELSSSWACSQARAAFQSRFTVRTETPSTEAASSSVKPPKYSISTSRALRPSHSARRVRASSRTSSCSIRGLAEA